MTKPKFPRQWNSTLPSRSTPLARGGRPIKKVGQGKAKRQARNAAYYKSAEWRAKRKAVFERDAYQCTEGVAWRQCTVCRRSADDCACSFKSDDAADRCTRLVAVRCPNRGEIVNGKRTARGLVCEEKSYGHRGTEGYIDTCTTRCTDCDRRLTPLERINHRYGFRRASGGAGGAPE